MRWLPTPLGAPAGTDWTLTDRKGRAWGRVLMPVLTSGDPWQWCVDGRE